MNLIKSKGPVSKADIVRITKVRPATVISIINSLMEENFVHEEGLGESSGGRKPVLLKLNPKAKYVLGIYIRYDEILGALVDLEGNIEEKLEVKNAFSKDKNFFIKELTKLIDRLLKEISINKKNVLGIGIAIPGLVDNAAGEWSFSICKAWCRDIPLGQILEDEFNIQVKIENDTRCLALAEKWFGRARNIKDFLFVDTGEGVSLGIILNNQLYSGTGYSAGELGHTTIDIKGPLCKCGNYGCLEAMASDDAMISKITELINKGVSTSLKDVRDIDITPEAIIEHAKRGDKLCSQILEEISTNLGIGIANIVNIFNPKVIIIGGRLAEAGDIALGTVKRTVRNRSLQKPAQDVEVYLSNFKNIKGAQGAATLILQGLFNTP
ncbi:MAG: ROK family protein [bacterium]